MIPLLLACSSPAPVDSGAPDSSPPADTAAPAVLAVEQTTLAFGEVQRGCTTSQPLSIANTGEQDLTFTTALGGDGSSAFSVSPDAGTLSGGEALDLTVGFAPSAWFDYAVDLSLTTSGGEATLSLTGTGIAGETVTEEITHAVAEAVDVLLLVDSTESMADYLVGLSAAMPAMWSVLADNGSSVHLGVLTMDMEEHGGRLLGHYTEADATPALPEATSTATEQGLAALSAALSEPLLSTDNAGFLRAGVPLSVAVLSDEDDDSDLDVEAIEAWLLKEGVTLHAMVGNTDIANNICETEPGERYVDLQVATGGRFALICDEDPAGALTDFAETVLQISPTFSLSAVPDSAQGITVLRNGVAVSQDRSDGWTFDATDNTLTLHGEATPELGDVLTFTYTTASCS